MDRILENLVEAEAVVENPTASDINLNSDDEMNDVMKVLTGFDDYEDAVNSENGPKGIDSFTTVTEISKEVDKAALANEKVIELNLKQEVLQRRFQDLSRKINKLRCLSLGTHITEEMSSLHDYCSKVAPPVPPANIFATPKMPNINLGNLRPPLNMPEGVVLPSVPQPPSNLPTQVKEELEDSSQISLQPPSLDEKSKVDEVLGQLSSNLKHMIDTYDSDATDSSSGGESCDEMDNFSHRNERIAPIKKRAKWTWLHNRASIASKWTWLTAQISDLEYRIRQQTDFYRQIRAAKGAVTLGEPTISWPAHAKKAVQSLPGMEVPLSVKPPTRDYSRVDSQGRKIIIKELAPMAITNEELEAAANQNDDTFTACRTRPIKTLRRRRILGTLGLHRTSNRAAKESSVRCDCIRPHFWCAICFGRSNHLQNPDPVFHDKAKTAALLDHSYHQVLSGKSDIPLDLYMMQMIKNRSWLVSGAQAKAKLEAELEAKKKKKLKKNELLPRKKMKRRESEGSNSQRKKLKASKNHRRKSVTVHHQDGVSMVDIGAVSDDFESLPNSPSISNHQSLADQIRKKRETAFDIDNIVIPYSIAASTRVEKLKYKEILTPTWRVIDGKEVENCEPPQPKLPKKQKPAVVKKVKEVKEVLITAEMAEAAASATEVEDINESSYEVRHSKAEIEERKRWSQPLKVIGMGSGSNRNRSQKRQNSQADSGCNTPDPMSPSQVENMEISRPSTPTENNAEIGAKIKNRRRTSSTTIKSRDRNPSEDAAQGSSRCTTPGLTGASAQEIDPFEPRKFPLTDEEYTVMLDEMPDGFEVEDTSSNPIADNPVPADSVQAQANLSATNVQTVESRRASSQDSSNFDDELIEEDPDWSGDHEDPDDPEWTSRNENSDLKETKMKKPATPK